ncbi:MAG: MerR family DNA-binding transcriptional regulator [Planctomycetota bacterium]|jgi:hypothetical protein
MGVPQNSLGNQEAGGKIPVHRHPLNNYRLFEIGDLEELLRRTERSARRKKRWSRKRPP